MTPGQRSLPIEPLRPGELPPRAPRGFVAVRLRGTQHIARRAVLRRTLCGIPADFTSERQRPTAICQTCAASIAELAR